MFSGLKAQTYKNISSIKEIICSASSLPHEVRFLFLSITRDSQKVATLDTSDNSCQTFANFASCNIDEGDKRRSQVRILVADLKGGESTRIGCKVNSYSSLLEDSLKYDWTLDMYMPSKI